MATDEQNITTVGYHATTAQALSINHATSYDIHGEIDAVYIDGHYVSVDSIEFADYVAPLYDSASVAAVSSTGK